MSFREGALEVRNLIRRDAERFAGDPAAKAFLEHLPVRLFDPMFDVGTWRRSIKISRGTADRIAAELGPLKTYLDTHRVRVAERLLRETDAAVADVGRRVGFEVTRTFSRTFRRILGLTPQELRDLEKRPDADLFAGTEEGDLSLAALAATWRRRVTLGFAGERQLAELMKELGRLYPRPGPFRHWRGYRRGTELGTWNLPYIENAELAEMAEPVVLSIVYDEKHSPERLRPLFREIRNHLYDRDLTLDEVLERAGGGERSVWSSFRAAVGRPAWSYVREARMETAAILLLRTSFLVSQVGPLVGYASRPAFRKAFEDFTGELPAEYRRRARRLVRRLGNPPVDVEEPGFWEAALDGKLDAEEAWKLDAYLGRYRAVLGSGGRPRAGV